MRLQVESYDGHDLHDSSYNAVIPNANNGFINLASVDLSEVLRGTTFPSYAGKVMRGKYFSIYIECNGTLSSQYDTLKQWFNPVEQSLKKLLFTDLADSNKQWYIMCTCVGHPRSEGKLMVFSMYAPEPNLLVETQNTDTWAITASGQTNDITVVGNAKTHPIFEITPTEAKAGGYSQKRYLPLYNITATPFVDYPWDITDGGLDTATLVTATKMQADGDDIRVMYDGVEIPYWLADINTDHTKIWINITLKPKAELALVNAIADTGTVATIAFTNTNLSGKFFDAIAPTNGRVLIGSEIFTYAVRDTKARSLTGCIRAMKGTSMAAHSAGDIVRFIEHDIWLMYGNADAIAPEQNELKKPVIDLSTSTNTSWVYAAFADDAQLRTGSWKPSLLSSTGKQSHSYSATFGTGEADPATVMGMLGETYQASGVWKSETFSHEWKLYHPMGITHVSSNGSKERYMTTSWPAKAALQKGASGRHGSMVWNDQWNQTTPTALSTLETWTKNSEALGATYNYIRFFFYGSIAGGKALSLAVFEVADCTLTLDSSNKPAGALSAEQANYYMDATIANTTTGESIRVTYLMFVNDKITIDGEAKTALCSDGTNIGAAVQFSSVRSQWLDIVPGVNAFSYTDVGCGDVTVVTKWRDRSA